MSNDIRIERLSGNALVKYIPELARLRIEASAIFLISMTVITNTKKNTCKLISTAQKA